MLRNASLVLIAIAAACGGSAPNTPASLRHIVSKTEADDRCPDPADFDSVSERIESELNVARRAVCKYRTLDAALADGYVDTGLPCIPGQGYHYVKPSLVGTTDIRHPSVLMYTADGELNGPEWIAPMSQFPSPPAIFGQSMHAEDELGLWILHVWVWKLNPDGVFADVNPDVTCP